MRSRTVTGAAVAVALLALGTWKWIEAGQRVKEEKQRETARLETIGSAVERTLVTTSGCDERAGCQCTITPNEVFEGCRMIEGHIVLMIRSVDECAMQWAAVNTTWAGVSSPMYFGATYVSRLPRRVAPAWSLLALAPCVD